MGCANSSAHKLSTDSSAMLTKKALRQAYEVTRAEPHKIPELTRRQREMIWLLWKFMYSDVENDVGLDIFKQVLYKSGRVQEVFHVPADEVRNIEQNGRVISHAKIVKNALHTLLSTLARGSDTDVEQLPQKIRKLGARHVTMRPDGFTPDLWFLFAEGLAEVIDNWPIPLCHRKETKRVWQRIVCFIIINMRIGYNEEAEGRQRDSQGAATRNDATRPLRSEEIVLNQTNNHNEQL